MKIETCDQCRKRLPDKLGFDFMICPNWMPECTPEKHSALIRYLNQTLGLHWRSVNFDIYFLYLHFSQKNEPKNSTLLPWCFKLNCFRLLFGSIEETKKTFRNLLTFGLPHLLFQSENLWMQYSSLNKNCNKNSDRKNQTRSTIPEIFTLIYIPIWFVRQKT